jgi:hypothetical protein
MSSDFRTRPVTLQLPVIPRRYVRGDKRNYRRWHCWVEAVKVLADHFKGAAASQRGARSSHGR